MHGELQMAVLSVNKNLTDQIKANHIVSHPLGITCIINYNIPKFIYMK